MSSKIMYIMSGVPGSGKSTLAEKISQLTNAVICSADSFLYENGVYFWTPSRAGMAHNKCQEKAKNLCSVGANLIIDNTNTKLSDMKFYLNLAVENDYDVKIVMPDNWWSQNVIECSLRNSHNVPAETIERMLDNLNSSTVESRQEFLNKTFDMDIKIIKMKG